MTSRIVLRIFISYAEGMSYRDIAIMLNNEGVPTSQSPRSKRRSSWSKNAIHGMLKNTRYIGQVYCNTSYEELDPETGKRHKRPVPRERWEFREAPELQIIPTELWERVQQKRKERARIGVQKSGGMARTEASRRYLLSGLMNCGVCDGNIMVVTSRPTRYGCASHRHRGDCVNEFTVRQDQLEKAFLEALSKKLRSQKLREELIRAVYAHLLKVKNQQVETSRSTEAQRGDLEANRAELERLKRNVLKAIREMGGRRSLYDDHDDIDVRIGRIDEMLATAVPPATLEITMEELREFVDNQSKSFQELLLASPERVKSEFQKRITSITLTPAIDERGVVYQVTGDVDLFSLPQGGLQTNQVDLIGLQSIFLISFTINPYQNTQHKKIRDFVGFGQYTEAGSGMDQISQESPASDADDQNAKLNLLQTCSLIAHEKDLPTFQAMTHSCECPSIAPAPHVHAQQSCSNGEAGTASAVQVFSDSNPTVTRLEKLLRLYADRVADFSLPEPPLTVSASLNARYNREKLYDEVWTYPMRTIAPRYRVSDSALRKTCRKLHVPVPPAGHWNKFAAGKPVVLPPVLPQVRVAEKRPRPHGIHKHNPGERNSIMAQIVSNISSGERIASACCKAGISSETYRRWQKQSALPTSDALRSTPKLSAVDRGCQELPKAEVGVQDSKLTPGLPDSRSAPELASIAFRATAHPCECQGASPEPATFAPQRDSTVTIETTSAAQLSEGTGRTESPFVKLLRIYDRKKLYEQLWSTPGYQLAKQYGIAYKTFRKRCWELRIPFPKMGYFRKLRTGSNVEQPPPLPDVQSADVLESGRTNKVYSPAEVALMLQQISDAVSKGEAIWKACRTTGIAEETYFRWRKRPPEPLDAMESCTAPKVSAHLLDRYVREKLYQEVWAGPMIHLAKQYGVSDVALAGACHKLLIPRPPHGYWQKIEAGKPVEERPPLPNVSRGPNIRRLARPYTLEEIAQIRGRIAQLVAAGHTIAGACRTVKIHEWTYRRWLKLWTKQLP